MIAPRSRKRLWAGVGAVGVVLTLLVAWLLGGESVQRSVAADRVRIAEVTRGAFVSDLSAQGRVVAAVSPTLYAPAQGTVALMVAAGERVQKGQTLAVLDSPEITNEFAREDANLQGLRATYERGRIDVATQRLRDRQTVELAKVSAEGAERELRRAQDAYSLGVLPVMEVDRRSDELRKANLEYANAHEETQLKNESLDFQLKTRQLEVDRQKLLVDNLQRRVDELTVLAPVDGVIGTLSVVERQSIAANASLMTVVDLSRLEAEIQVPETYAESLGLNMPAEISVGGKLVRGHLTAISPEVNNNMVTGRVAFDEAMPPELRQNQRLSVRILLDNRDNVVQLPRGGFVDNGGGRWAYVVRDGIARRTPITVGAIGIDRVEITSGLAAGDQVVISGDDLFQNDDTVRIR